MGTSCVKFLEEDLYPGRNMKKYAINRTVYSMAKREKINWFKERKLIGASYDTDDMIIFLPLYWDEKIHKIILESITPGVYHCPIERTFYRKDILVPPTQKELEELFTPAKAF